MNAQKAKTSKAAAIVAVFLTLVIGGASTAYADNPGSNENYNSISWKIVTRFHDAAGRTIPLRVGQNDYHPPAEQRVVSGFGQRHIRDAHGVVPDAEVIQEALTACGHAAYYTGRITCKTDEVTVVYNNTADKRSGDNIAFGIITAFYPAGEAIPSYSYGCGC